MNYICSEFPPDSHQWQRVVAEIVRAESRMRRYTGRCVLCDVGTPEHYLSCPFGVLATYGIVYEGIGVQTPISGRDVDAVTGFIGQNKPQYRPHWVRPSTKERIEAGLVDE